MEESSSGSDKARGKGLTAKDKIMKERLGQTQGTKYHIGESEVC